MNIFGVLRFCLIFSLGQSTKWGISFALLKFQIFSWVLRGGRCLFMEEGYFCLIGAAYTGNGTPMDKDRILRDLFKIL